MPVALLLALALLMLPFAAHAQTTIAPDSTVALVDTTSAPEQYWRRTRFILSGAYAVPSGSLEPDLNAPVYGGGVGLEFASRSRLRAQLDLSALSMLISQNDINSDIQEIRTQQYSSHAGLRWFPSKKLEGVHFDVLWGIDLNMFKVTSVVDPSAIPHKYTTIASLQPALSLAAGMGVVVGSFAFSVRYQVEPVYTPWNDKKQWTGRDGLAVFRLGFVLGGKRSPLYSNPQKDSFNARHTVVAKRTGSTKSQLAWQTNRADSLEQIVLAQQDSARQLKELQALLSIELKQQKNLAERAMAKTDSISALPPPVPPPYVPRYSVLYENPFRFNAISVYTVLRSFSEPQRPDTFRVVTTVPPNGGYKHELQISTVNGNLYKEAFYALPLRGAAPEPTTTEELELLRVRMALAPDAFLSDPVTDAAIALSDAREARDLVFQLTQAQFKTVQKEHPRVGFRFQSDEHTTKVLVYSPMLNRIVNIEPE